MLTAIKIIGWLAGATLAYLFIRVAYIRETPEIEDKRDE